MTPWREVDAALLAALDAGALSGVVAAVTDRSGPVYMKSAGALRPGGPPMPDDAIFWIASMAKALSSAAAMQLVERGALALDTPIADLLPGLGEARILSGFDGRGHPVLRSASTPITLRHLLTHTSGLSGAAWDELTAQYARQAGLPPADSRRLRGLELPLLFEPGAGWHYGISHEWVGLAVENAAGQPLDLYMKRHLFDPLGMSDTTWSPRPQDAGRRPAILQRRDDGGLEPTTRAATADPEYVSGGGYMYATAGDYLSFIRAILNDGGGVLEPETVAEMSRNQTGSIAVGRLDPTPGYPVRRHVFMNGFARCWGLGFQINLEPLPTGRSAGSMAWGGLGNTFFWIDRGRGIGGVFLTQILPFCDASALAAFERFEGAVYAALERRYG